MQTANYVLLDASGTVVNACVWDGVTLYEPPAGLTIELQPAGVDIGCKKNTDGTWSRRQDGEQA